MRLITFFTAILLGLLGIIGIAIVLSIPTYLLWNWLMPTLFSLKQITLMQALGINLLAGLLFKSTITTSKS